MHFDPPSSGMAHVSYWDNVDTVAPEECMTHLFPNFGVPSRDLGLSHQRAIPGGFGLGMQGLRVLCKVLMSQRYMLLIRSKSQRSGCFMSYCQTVWAEGTGTEGLTVFLYWMWHPGRFWVLIYYHLTPHQVW